MLWNKVPSLHVAIIKNILLKQIKPAVHSSGLKQAGSNQMGFHTTLGLLQALCLAILRVLIKVKMQMY